MPFVICSRMLSFPSPFSYPLTRLQTHPQYHAEEATKAIWPMLGASYREDKQRSFWIALWESFTMYQYVEPSDEDAMPKDREMMYRAGPAPPVERMMGRGGVVVG